MNNWQILDVGSIWMKEFASALSSIEPVIAWSPKMEQVGLLRTYQRPSRVNDPPLDMLSFPLQRGYARTFMRWIFRFERSVVRRLLSQTDDPVRSPLICTTPFYAPVAELWPGPVIYYVTDMTAAYDGLNPSQVKAFDKRLCRVARSVCPNSRRIAEYLCQEALCAPAKITIVPNATREANIRPHPAFEPDDLPADIRTLRRPIAGVLGDLSGNMDWELLAGAIRQTPDITWLFVGPVSRPVHNSAQRAAREWAQQHACFVGAKPYGELQAYARSLDVAVLPYRKHEPTYSGSSTRFYEHLAAGRPMIATRGFAELLEKEPLLKLVDTSEELVQALQRLKHSDFRDHHEAERWAASKVATWEHRARALSQSIQPPRREDEGTVPAERGLVSS